ncbi:MAG TPA: hypothetical protein GXX53_08375 [Tissierellia bacterium]|nr:hypothetical protein [Tissierellia bacterium]
MKIRSYFPDLKSATEAVRKLKSEGIKSVYVDANSYKDDIDNIEESFISLAMNSVETNSLTNNINGNNVSKNRNVFVVIVTKGENINKAKEIVENMGGIIQ